MPFNQKVDADTIEELPPVYESVLDEPNKIYAEENEILREENQLLGQKVSRLEADSSSLKQAKSLLEEQIKLLNQQIELIRKSKQQLSANLQSLSENYALQQRKNSELVEWLALSAADEERTLIYIDALASCATSLRNNPEISELRFKLQELDSNLQVHKGEVSAEIEKQVNEKAQIIQENVLELFHKLITSEAFTQLVSNLEEKLTDIVRRDEKTFLEELAEKIPVPNELTKQYLDEKTKKLMDLKQIHSDEKVSLFYNTSYIVLWAKIVGVISVFSELVEKKAGIGEKAVDLTSSVVGGLLGSVPVVGALLDTIASFTLKEIGGAVIGHFDDKKMQNILEILRNPDHAKKMAELFARSLTLCHQLEIQSWDAKTIKHAATMYSNRVYELSIGGKIKECMADSTEEKVAVFLDAVNGVKEASRDVKSVGTSSPKPKFSLQEKSLKTSVHEGTQTLRKKLSETEFFSKHTSVVVKGIKRQNSDFQQEAIKQQEQISELKLQVATLQQEAKQRDEEIRDLKTLVSGLQEIMANWLVESPEPVAVTKVTKKSSLIKNKLKLFSSRDSEERATKFVDNTVFGTK
ncbi:hypothetical protein [Legionella brunensis]|uniref:Uncharacterized protein n=1 Tax=Legionella brunensis TaxID=29422 RepID=A0A0W0SUF6_9GAMM|nr:hypothetical protein [Legionella brunensis]KTC87007.1 hypothetical protein Lbru_0236 [Legionella brunensis]